MRAEQSRSYTRARAKQFKRNCASNHLSNDRRRGKKVSIWHLKQSKSRDYISFWSHKLAFHSKYNVTLPLRQVYRIFTFFEVNTKYISSSVLKTSEIFMSA